MTARTDEIHATEHGILCWSFSRVSGSCPLHPLQLGHPIIGRPACLGLVLLLSVSHNHYVLHYWDCDIGTHLRWIVMN